jgi:hypothetical protein
MCFFVLSTPLRLAQGRQGHKAVLVRAIAKPAAITASFWRNKF